MKKTLHILIIMLGVYGILVSTANIYYNHFIFNKEYADSFIEATQNANAYGEDKSYNFLLLATGKSLVVSEQFTKCCYLLTIVCLIVILNAFIVLKKAFSSSAVTNNVSEQVAASDR